MISAIPSFSKLPVEIERMVLSYLSHSELCKVREVCKKWRDLMSDQIIWGPAYRKLHPLTAEIHADADIKTVVLAELQEKVHRILCCASTDSELAMMMGSSSVSLETLDKMLPMERSLHVMRIWKVDSTRLLIYLIGKHGKDLLSAVKEPRSMGREDLLEAAINDYCRDNKILPLLLELISCPLGPFNAGNVMSAIVGPLHMIPTINNLHYVCASLITSRCDLSEFFQSTISYESLGFKREMAMMELVETMLIPQMSAFGIDREDWIKCGYPDGQ